MKNCLVSIVIPVYNRENLISVAIESAINQTHKFIEIIIIDNNSSDKTWTILENYSKKDSRIRIFKNESNVGPVRNWVKGINYSKGDFVKILFSDDWLSQNDIEENLKYLYNNDSVGFVYNPAVIYDKYNRPEGLYYYLNSSSKQIDSDRFIKRLLLNDNVPVSPCCGLFRRNDLLETIRINISNKKNMDFSQFGAGNDLLIFLDIASKYKYVYFSNNVFINFFGHSESFTKRYNLKYFYKVSRLLFIKERYSGIKNIFYFLLVVMNIPIFYTLLNLINSKYQYKKRVF